MVIVRMLLLKITKTNLNLKVVLLQAGRVVDIISVIDRGIMPSPGVKQKSKRDPVKLSQAPTNDVVNNDPPKIKESFATEVSPVHLTGK